MSEKNKDLKSRFADRSVTKAETARRGTYGTTSDTPSPFFAIERGNRFVRRFKLLFRDGKTISVPYAYLPVILYEPSNRLIIKTSEVEITIAGRSLDQLADWLSEEKVLWMKESGSGVDAQDDEIFIASITIDGELLN